MVLTVKGCSLLRWGQSYCEFYYVNASIAYPYENIRLMIEMQGSYQIQIGNYIEELQCGGMVEEWRRRVAEWAFSVRMYVTISDSVFFITLHTTAISSSMLFFAVRILMRDIVSLWGYHVNSLIHRWPIFTN